MDNVKNWKPCPFCGSEIMYRCVTDESGTYGWGRVLDYLGIEWENEIGQIKGQMNIFDFITE